MCPRLLTKTLLLVALRSLGTALHAQAPPPPPPGPGPPPTWNATPPNTKSARFEVATIRLSKSVSVFGGGMQAGPGRLSLLNMTLEAILKSAYGNDLLLDGLPGWARSQRYDIVAKAYETPDLAQMRLALRPLLAERLGLAVHQETREVPVFILRVDGKAPQKLRLARGPKRPDEPDLRFTTGSIYYLSGEHTPIAQLVRVLSGTLGRPVVDRTGLTGEYAFNASWRSDQHYPDGVSIFTAIKEQLGLRLESARGPAQVLVIDKVNRTPTDN